MKAKGEHIVFAQPFGINAPGGGPRILRALLKEAPIPWTSVCAQAHAAPPTSFGREIHLRKRPYLGRIERTRFSWIANAVEPLFERRFEQRLEMMCRELGATAIHSIPHGL